MNSFTHLEIEIDPLPPFTIDRVQEDLPQDIRQAAIESGLSEQETDEKVDTSAPVRLPTPEQLEIIKLTIEIALMVGPVLYNVVKKILKKLKQKYTRVRVNLLSVGGQTYFISIEGENIESVLEMLKQITATHDD